MTTFPVHGVQPWDGSLQEYIDSQVRLYSRRGPAGQVRLPDTGWRKIPIGGSAIALYVRRVGRTVLVVVNPQASVSPEDLSGSEVPYGFYPAAYAQQGTGVGPNSAVWIEFGQDDYSAGLLGMVIDSQGVFHGTGITTDGMFGRVEYETDDDFPSVLPGVEVTPAQVLDAGGQAIGLPSTGRRRLPAATAPDVGCDVSRIGNTVTVYVNFRSDNLVGRNFPVIPGGFRPITVAGAPMIGDDFSSQPGSVFVSAIGEMTGWDINGSDAISSGIGEITYETADPFPDITDLPGTAITPPSIVPVVPAPYIEPDTGPRVLNVGAATIQFQRIGNVCTLRLSGDFGVTEVLNGVVPVGVRPVAIGSLTGASNNGDGGGVQALGLDVDGTVYLIANASGDEGLGIVNVATWTYLTSDAFPNPVPGDPFEL